QLLETVAAPEEAEVVGVKRAERTIVPAQRLRPLLLALEVPPGGKVGDRGAQDRPRRAPSSTSSCAGSTTRWHSGRRRRGGATAPHTGGGSARPCPRCRACRRRARSRTAARGNSTGRPAGGRPGVRIWRRSGDAH